MCNQSCILFGATHLNGEEIKGKRVLEVGSVDVNGSLRDTVTVLEPREYIGVDIEAGKDVDIVCSAENIIDQFGKESFDAVISTEMLEHVRDWKKVISNIKNIVRPGGVVLLTTRSRGFRYHGFPYDFWRFEEADMDMRDIFSDFNIQALGADHSMPGIMIKAKKPVQFAEKDLSAYALYSIVTNKWMTTFQDSDFDNCYFKRLKLKMRLRETRKKIRAKFSSKAK
jgi:SAM-dependent methyltransferase